MALQGGVSEHQHILEQLGATVRLVRRAEHLANLDGIILPGGESTTMTKLLHLGDLFAPLQQAIRNGLPTYGTCAGMILLAGELDVLAADVRRNAFGRQTESFEIDLDIAGVGADVHAVFIRAPWVESVADGVDILGRVPAELAPVPTALREVEARAGKSAGTQQKRDHIVAVQQRGLQDKENILATSFHPEVTYDLRVHEYFLNEFVGRQQSKLHGRAKK
ncbi:MAG: pyridoxal 5'-phosphate synthase glutaminase subunit PdxT [Corynebacterium sp.]|nr:pyridoxal 5'-phosphate synthase glutaminase subunit PdxT [Corynebacterium sp.]